MRKYIKLILILTAIFSVLIMLVYRYKYYNLRSLLEIMNFFAATKARNRCLPKQSYSNITPETFYSINHWTEIFDGVHIYSLHMLSKTVISLAYSNDVSVSELKSIQCNIWFDGVMKSSQSNLDVHILSANGNSLLFYLECKRAYNYSNPNAVTFLKNNNSVTLPLFHKEQYTGSLAACVNLPQFFDNADLILEFFIYHTHLGIKHYILYYSVFSKTIQELLVNITKECDIIIELLPWVTPSKFKFSRMKLKPFLVDCIFHASSLKHSDFVLSLNLNNFLILEEGVDLQKFINNNSPFDYFQLRKKMFCAEYPNNVIAEELSIKFNALLKTKMLNFDIDSVNVMYNIKNRLSPFSFMKLLSNKNKQSHERIKSTSASIFSYSNCTKYFKNLSDDSYTENKKMWSFKRIFFESCIYKARG